MKSYYWFGLCVVRLRLVQNSQLQFLSPLKFSNIPTCNYKYFKVVFGWQHLNLGLDLKSIDLKCFDLKFLNLKILCLGLFKQSWNLSIEIPLFGYLNLNLDLDLDLR